MLSTANADHLLLMSVFLAAAFGGIAVASSRHGDADGNVDFNNIQTAIHDSNDGDTIAVRPIEKRKY